MEYRLRIKERLVLLGILPETGNLLTIRIVRELREALSFSEAEYEDVQMQRDGEQIRWQEPENPRPIEIGAKGQEIIREALAKLDKDEKLTADHLSLCELFEYEGD